ncbi:hypothetical protein [Streptomyces sp. NPDC060001]|uniref:hypothetical protein n=1 Tax=Streptomyces sp. NPDC060001 TaxID=3347032 RepID=UPI003686575E
MAGRLVHPAPAADRPGKRLIDDPDFRAELELCDRWGIPHSKFRGHGDGTWSELDRRKAHAYAAYHRTVCATCGTRADEWQEELGGDEDAYRAITHRCVGCQLIADKQKTVPDADEGHGVKTLLIPTSVHAAMQIARDAHRP